MPKYRVTLRVSRAVKVDVMADDAVSAVAIAKISIGDHGDTSTLLGIHEIGKNPLDSPPDPQCEYVPTANALEQGSEA